MPERPPEARPRVRRIALVGRRGVGKTSALMQLVAILTEQGIRVGGVVQPAVHRGGERIGYDLEDPSDGAHFGFARRQGSYEEAELSFAFDVDGWVWANTRIRRARKNADLLVVDELGKLEAQGLGHLPALTERPGDERCAVWLLSVRDLALDRVTEFIGPMDDVIRLTGDPEDLDVLENRVRRWLPLQPTP